MFRTEEMPEEFNRRAEGRQLVLAVGKARRVGADLRSVFTVATADISRSGMMMTCPPDAGLMPGDILQVVFPSEEPRETVDLWGRIVWRRNGGGDPAALASGGAPAPWRIGLALSPQSRPEAVRLLQD